jgi:hypothetical protein
MSEKPSDEKQHFGWFQARYLAPLFPFVEYAREMDPLRFLDGSIGLEPCAEGGAYLVAVTSNATVIIRDPEAHIDEPVTLDIPDAAFMRAQPIFAPCMNYEGRHYAVPAPEWSQPGFIYVYRAGMHIAPKMRHPMWAEEAYDFQPALFGVGTSVGKHEIGHDYRMTDGSPANWRALLKNVNTTPLADDSTLFFNPRVPALFFDLVDAVFEYEADRREDPWFAVAHTIAATKNANTAIVRFIGHPDIIGLWAGQRATEPLAPIPAHFFDIPTAEDGQ